MRRAFFLALAWVGGCASAPAEGGGTPDAAEILPSAAQELDHARLEAETGARWSLVLGPHGTPAALRSDVRHVEGAPVQGGEARELQRFLARHPALFRLGGGGEAFRVVREETDELAMTHVRLEQVEQGLRVEGGELMGHFDALGHLVEVDGTSFPSPLPIRGALRLNKDAAGLVALQAMREQVASFALSRPEEVDAVVHMDGDRGIIAYRVDIRGDAAGRPYRRTYVVDAESGAILSLRNNLMTLAGSGIGVNGAVKSPLEVSQVGGTFQLVDAVRNVRTTTAANVETAPGRLVTSNSASTWDRVAVGAGAAVDAHFHTGIVVDYYKQKHGRNNVDGAGGTVVSTAHYGSGFDNAFWDGQQMAYGDGATIFRPLSGGLDVVAHELTHGITERTSALVYERQSGALNEAVSDIFGQLVERFANPGMTSSVHGDEIAKTPQGIRDMAHPARGQQPAHMSAYQNLPNTEEGDNGGVHVNSGIVNNAWFLMTRGGTNDVSKTEVKFGIGWDKSEQLWFRAATRYFTSRTDFAAAARATQSAATDLKFTDNEKNIVDCAWIAVGILPGTCKPLTDPTPVPAPGSPPGAGGKSGESGAADGLPASGDEELEEGAAGAKKGSKRTSVRRPGTGAEASGCSVGPSGTSGATDLGLWLTALVLGSRVKRRRVANRRGDA